MSTQSGKDVIYIDIDDEITTLIDKVRGSDQRIVALVLPKRATVLQSIVNMKLLKRTADGAKKHLVLITNETGLMPLAGAVGLYVAKTLQTKPEIPHVAGGGKDLDDVEEAVDMNDAPEDKLDKSRAVGDYAKGASSAIAFKPDDDDQPIELDNASMDVPGASAGDGKKPKKKKDKKLAIPDFNKFRLWLILGGAGLVLLIFLGFIAFNVMPRATITVKTDSEAVDTNIDLTLSTAAEDVDADEALVPSKLQQSQKTGTQVVASTGQKDKGTKASGSVSMNAGSCTGDAPSSVASGTAVSTNGLTFITQDTASFQPSFKNSKCTWVADGIDIISQNNGDKYNVGSSSLSVAGRSDVTATTSGTSGGTSVIVKVVAQADIDSAKQKIAEQDSSAVKKELQNGLEGQGLFAIEGSFKAGDPEITPTAQPGDEAENVTVTAKTTYTMVGVKEGDLKKVIANEVNKKIDPTKQEILDYGLETAVFKLQNQTDTETLVTLQDTAVAGSSLDLTAIKKQVAGKKAGEAKDVIGQYPGVTNVDVHYSPFWVSSIPKNTGKITVSVEKPTSKDAQ
jgi:hypothetical protein